MHFQSNSHQGPNLSPTTACTTGAHAIAEAASLIRLNQTNVGVAGASESCIHPLALSGFARARSLSTSYNDSPGQASRPFDRGRDGFVIGEGAGILILEELEHARQRGAKIYAELKGVGMSCDAWHMTAPRNDGQGARLAMTRALGDAGLQPEDIQYINAHATGTVIGDNAENQAIRDTMLFNPSGLSKSCHGSPSSFAVSSTKGAMGHLLGAAGAVEAIFTVLALRHGVIPPTLNLNQAGNGDEDDVQNQATFNLNYVPKKAQQMSSLRAALTNSFGFGGTNASLCFRALQD